MSGTRSGCARRRPSSAGETRRQLFQHRADGALTAVTDSRHGERTFALDRAGRVTAARGGAGWDEDYRYDILGNLVAFETSAPVRENDPGPGERSYSGTLMERAGRTRYHHDAQGRVVRRITRLLSGGRREWRYTWNAEDQLTDVLTPDGRHWRYVYDPVGRRVAKRLLADDGTTVVEQTRYFWDQDDLAEQTDGTVSTSWDWTDGPTPVSQRVRATRPRRTGHPPGRDRRTLLRHRHRPPGHTDRTARHRRHHRLDPAIDPVGRPPGGGPRPPRRLPATVPGPVLRRGDRAPLQPPPLLRARHGPLPEPRPAGPHTVPESPRVRKKPLRWKDPLGLKAPCTVDLYHGTYGSAADNIIANGINPVISPRPMDFGFGGFYVTNSPRQALRWAHRLAGRNNDIPAVLHFRVPKSELDKLNSKIFDGPSDELAAFIRRHRRDRTGADMHGYEMVEGPMVMNPGPLVKGAEGEFKGHQMGLYSERAAQLFDDSLLRRLGP
ncbi:hypothetical protein SFUMM280S_11158 [Streptomyces fumanus]